MGGGTVGLPLAAGTVIGLSPRGRGNRVRVGLCRRSRGSIPAWAGEPCTGRLMQEVKGVYPRVGGGTVYGSGLCRRSRGSIPAWAGEPHAQRLETCQ